jgi:hypothetical protein
MARVFLEGPDDLVPLREVPRARVVDLDGSEIARKPPTNVVIAW